MIYVTSDWHGCPLQTVQALLCKAEFSANDYCFVLGDVIDRGEHGVELLQWLSVQENIELFRGNHEDMMLDCEFLFEEITEKSIDALTSKKLEAVSLWQYNGGQPTINALKKLPAKERRDLFEFVADALLFDRVEVNGRKYILLHSGFENFDPAKAPEDYEAEELLWNRPQPDTTYYPDITAVFGHTPTVCFGGEYKGKVFKTETWIDVDVGAAMGLPPMLFRLDDGKEFYL